MAHMMWRIAKSLLWLILIAEGRLFPSLHIRYSHAIAIPYPVQIFERKISETRSVGIGVVAPAHQRLRSLRCTPMHQRYRNLLQASTRKSLPRSQDLLKMSVYP